MDSVNSENRPMISRGSQMMMKKMASRGHIRSDSASNGLYENALKMLEDKSTREKEKTQHQVALRNKKKINSSSKKMLMGKFREEFSKAVGLFSDNDFLTFLQYLNVLNQLKFIERYDPKVGSEQN